MFECVVPIFLDLWDITVIDFKIFFGLYTLDTLILQIGYFYNIGKFSFSLLLHISNTCVVSWTQHILLL